MAKILAVLEIDRPLKNGENPVKDIFSAYKGKYDFIVFPWREDKLFTEVVFFNCHFLRNFEGMSLSPVEFTEAGMDSYFDLDLDGVNGQTFYNMLSRQFEFDRTSLSSIESN